MAGTKTVDKPGAKATATVEDDKTEVDITELEKFEPSRVDGVKAGANGFPILMLKSLPEQTEKADAPDETHGSFTGTHTHGHDAHGDQGDDDTHSHSHSHSGDGDHSHSHAGKATAELPDWHARAANLARLGKAAPTMPAAALYKAVVDGAVDEQPDIDGGQAAIELIGKLIEYEAQELQAGCYGETSDIQMLTDAAQCLKYWLAGEERSQAGGDSPMGGLVMDAAKGADTADTTKNVAEGTKTVETEPSTGDDNLNKAVAAAVTEATKGAKEEIASLRAEMAKVLALPIPGGPVTSTPAVRPKSADGTDWAAKAIEYRDMAARMTNPADADAFRTLAAQAAEKAAELSA